MCLLNFSLLVLAQLIEIFWKLGFDHVVFDYYTRFSCQLFDICSLYELSFMSSSKF